MSSEARTLRPVQRLALFDGAVAALWRCAHPTIGELTLMTLFDRVLREAAQAFPQLAALKLDESGVSFRELRESGIAGRDAELDEALRFLLVELLAAIGALTGETLTPLLHGALARSATRERTPPASPAP